MLQRGADSLFSALSCACTNRCWACFAIAGIVYSVIRGSAATLWWPFFSSFPVVKFFATVEDRCVVMANKCSFLFSCSFFSLACITFSL
ncbi:hypothetical protein ANAPC1_01273 [Anaplasma phagocytophilum]|uniref:Uncharacterized protein n=1 Tax=Anaplasma phagocytophilum TaxID=948 RepID=A0AA45UUB8_ANAPH|nr:hypothetical protein [Anaplasma phagocytophilum]SBO14897.1 hypothetical protein ANAPC1_01273 [Anaplasma phagocytophilum]